MASVRYNVSCCICPSIFSTSFVVNAGHALGVILSRLLISRGVDGLPVLLRAFYTSAITRASFGQMTTRTSNTGKIPVQPSLDGIYASYFLHSQHIPILCPTAGCGTVDSRASYHARWFMSRENTTRALYDRPGHPSSRVLQESLYPPEARTTGGIKTLKTLRGLSVDRGP